MLIAKFSKKGEKIEIANSLWQYDYGQRIQIEGLNLPEIFEAHFSWKELEKTKIVTGTTVDGISVLDIPSETLKQSGVVTIYIYLSSETEGKTINTIILPVQHRKAPENFEIPKDIDLFHHTLNAAAEYQRRAQDNAENAEAWAHGREDHPKQKEDNAKYYAGEAQKAAASIPGRVEEGKKDIDNYVRQKETELKGETGNVHFAAFKVKKGRLKMYSDSTIDKVRFRRVGSRLKYRLKM